MNILINDDSLKTDKVFNDTVDLIITSPSILEITKL